MTIIADITLPAVTLPLGRVLQSFPDATIELERVVPLGRPIIPFLLIEGEDLAAIEASLRDHHQVERVDVQTTSETEALFDIQWSPDADGLVAALLNANATILNARGTAESWDFRLRFAAHEDLSTFNMTLTESGVPVTLRRIHHTPFEEAAPMSSVQRETLLSAYREGYFQVPRRINQADLAAELEISDSALSQRLRRGVAKLIETGLLSEDQRSE